MRREGYDNSSVCVSVCYQANCHILGLYVQNKVPLGFSWQLQPTICVDFVENGLFKSSGDICWPPLPFSLLDELSINERDSDRFIKGLVVCRSSDSSCNSTDSSLLSVDYQLRFLATFFVCTRSADLAIYLPMHDAIQLEHCSRSSTFLSSNLLLVMYIVWSSSKEPLEL